jgi:hypothetical protein
MTHEELKQKIAEYLKVYETEAWEREYRTRKAQELLNWAIQSGDQKEIKKAEQYLEYAKNYKNRTLETILEIETQIIEKIKLSKSAALKKIEQLESKETTLFRLIDDHGYDSKVSRGRTKDEIRYDDVCDSLRTLKIYVAVCF